MIRVFILTTFILLNHLLLAQNVGIGTTNPLFPLHLVTSNQAIMGLDGGNNSYILFSENGLYRGYMGSFSGNPEDMDIGTGTTNLNGKLHLTTLGNPRLTVNSSGSVGIGTTNPQFPLDISTADPVLLSLNGGNNSFIRFAENGVYRGYMGSYSGNAEDMDFGTGTSNLNGKVHLTTLGSPRLTVGSNGFVGINNDNPEWNLDVNGDMRVQGRLITAGSAGSSGQVLTSNGSSSPSWSTLERSYDNTTRFAVSFTSNTSQIDYYIPDNTLYNLDPTNINVVPDGIVLSKEGLYHFDIHVQAQYVFSAPPAIKPDYTLRLFTVGRPMSFRLTSDQVMEGTSNTSSSTNFKHSGMYSIDIHVQAGQTIRLSYDFGLASGSGFFSYAYIYGYLISP